MPYSHKYIHITIIFCTLFITRLVQANSACKKSDVTAQYKTVSSHLEAQKSQLHKVLLGELGNNIIVESIFGHNFNLDQTASLIEALQAKNNSSTVISSEFGHLKDCLILFKMKERLNTIKEISKEINTLKIKIYKENLNQNGALKKAIETKRALPTLKSSLSSQTRETEQEKQRLEQHLLNSQLSKSPSTNKREQEESFFINTLTKLRIELLTQKIEQNTALEQKLTYFESQSKEIAKISNTFGLTDKELSNNFTKIEEIWLSTIEENFYQLFRTKFNFNLPQIPKLEPQQEQGSEERSRLIQAQLRDLSALKAQTLAELTDKKNQEIKLLNDLLIQVNNTRSLYYKNLDLTYTLKYFFSKDGYRLVKSEIKSSPYRPLSYIYSKYFYLNEKVSSGRKGMIQMSFDAIRIIFVLLALLALKVLFEKVSSQIDTSLTKLAWKFKSSSLIKTANSFWNKISDNGIHILWLAMAQALKTQNFVSDYILLVEVFEVYIGAKILKSLVILFLSSISRIDNRSFIKFKAKADLTSTKFSNIFLFYFLTLILVDATVGHVYVYSIIKVCILLYCIAHLVINSMIWEQEFTTYLERRFSGLIISKLTHGLKFAPRILRTLIIFLVILVLSIVDFFIKLTENFEISKKVSANLFKKQIEQVEAANGSDITIPQEYKEEFSLHSLSDEDEYVTADQNIEQSLIEEISSWYESSSEEHSLVIFGDKGIGKTTLLKHTVALFEQSKSEEVTTIYTKMPSKTCSKEKLQDFIYETFQLEKTGTNFDIYDIDTRLEKKTIVVIDEAQNVFLSHSGGFEAYYQLINTINLHTKNIFWVMSFNKYSWIYLDRAFGRTQFFRNVFELKGWDDSKIKELIMKRHNKSKFKLSYDLLINATRSQDEIDRYSSIEAKFFKLLWELSKGNPRAALHLWISALSKKSKTSFNVNIPKEAEELELEKQSDDLFFILAHILKHENLSSSEVEKTTNLPKGIVRNAIKVGQERSYLYRDERGRLMIDVATQHSLIRYLRLKNFIYGN